MLRDSRFINLWTALLLLLGSGRALADAAGAPIPLADIGARADAQAPSPAPALSEGRVTLPAPLQALRGELDATGLSVDSTSASEGGGQFRLTPARLDKGGAAVELPAGRVSLRERTAVLERGPLTELLTASGDGLRQDFVVAQPTEGDAPLTLTLALAGATAHAVAHGVGLTLPGGRELVYHGLHITDATGRVLVGALTAQDARTLTITVADAGARYPLTIDPTITDADWSALGDGLDGRVDALAVSGSDLYVGGRFTTAGGNSANNIAKWDGSAWSALGSGLASCSGSTCFASVHALAVSGGDLYVGGYFTTAGGKPASNIAKWTLGATGDAGWSALDNGLNGDVSALAISCSDLYVGGNFSTAGVVSAKNIAKWNGSVWSALGSGLDNLVTALAVSGSDLYVGGIFTTAGSGPAGRIAKKRVPRTCYV